MVGPNDTFYADDDGLGITVRTRNYSVKQESSDNSGDQKRVMRYDPGYVMVMDLRSKKSFGKLERRVDN